MTHKTDLKQVNRPFFIGIGGIGISAVARMFLGDGKKVSGSDLSDSEIISELRKAGAVITIGQSADLVPKDCDLIIYTAAIEVAEPKLIADLKKRNIKLLSYPQTLNLISKDKYTIAVSGTHGKTTTTAMIAKIMIDAGLDPTVIVGSLLKDSKSNFVAGKSGYFVVEACEYRRSFLNINPTIAVITNIDNDHLDYYKDMADIAKAFGEFASLVPKDGCVVADLKNEHVRSALKGVLAENKDYVAESDLGLNLRVPGKHNVQNAKAALAVAELLGIKRDEAVRSLNGFRGTWRRFEFKGKTRSGAHVYDDYGHHPTEIRATLSGAREIYPDNRLVVVFQPHLYSRTKLLLSEFATAFGLADEIVLAPIYAAREEPDPEISSAILGKEIAANNLKIKVGNMDTFADIERYLADTLKKDDVLITLGAGEANKIAENLVK
ncbi:MAG: UDP-N-acetylmuramate--L-alanine ligase [Candidatus Taylorbacteria bacterium]|nr:UDP-N-acetylmuramate--L-alanine ligase [Candidatus Taylorbacteria bacterium]